MDAYALLLLFCCVLVCATAVSTLKLYEAKKEKRRREKIMQEHYKFMEIVHFFIEQTGVPLTCLMAPDKIVSDVNLCLYYLTKTGEVVENWNTGEIQGIIGSGLAGTFILEISCYTFDSSKCIKHGDTKSFGRGFGKHVKGCAWRFDKGTRTREGYWPDFPLIDTSGEQIILPLRDKEKAGTSEKEVLMAGLLKFVNDLDSCTDLRLQQVVAALMDKGILAHPVLKAIMDEVRNSESNLDPNIMAIRDAVKNLMENPNSSL